MILCFLAYAAIPPSLMESMFAFDFKKTEYCLEIFIEGLS